VGLLTVLVATTSPLGLHGAGDPTRQAISHSLLLLVAPLFLAWGAPQALAVEAARPPVVRRLRQLIDARPARWLFSPVVAMALLFGSIGAVDLTSLHTIAGRHEALGELVQMALLAAGCVYMFPVFSTDPLPRKLPNIQALVYLLLLLPFFTLFGMAVESVGSAETITRVGSVAAAGAVGQDLASAGGVLWTVGGLGSIALTILVLVRWLRIEERATPDRNTGLDELAHAQLVAWREQREAAAAEDAARRAVWAARRGGATGAPADHGSTPVAG
jgi:putative copper resistance protein D